MIDESSRLTSDLLWRGTAIALLIDIPFLSLINHVAVAAAGRRMITRVRANDE